MLAARIGQNVHGSTDIPAADVGREVIASEVSFLVCSMHGFSIYVTSAARMVL